jgi:hypothetical protein
MESRIRQEVDVMNGLRTAVIFFFCGVLLFSSGCGLMKRKPAETASTAAGQVTCIGVLPAVPEVVAGGAAEKTRAADLRQGAEVMDNLLRQELQGRPDVRLVGLDLLSGLALTGGEDSREMARLVGERIGCNAILETTVSRFEEREGGEYSVEQPSAVAFDMRLYAADSGAVLWSATFDERQKTLSENLYELKKFRSRGFRWVTAEGLMLEGVRAKFAGSPYFSADNTAP